jgi:uncharacterized protein YdcH (DUF465 family)
MALKEQEIIEVLKRENTEFKKLSDEHQRFESMLEEINTKRYLTSDEELERKKVQKHKLAGKDRMAAIIRDYKKGQSVS